jgi:hypothetical protein
MLKVHALIIFSRVKFIVYQWLKQSEDPLWITANYTLQVF